jgi:sigma-54 dependent transcriptional regulator, acetoin dehydrogenase operon transcriptional activator AcoR
VNFFAKTRCKGGYDEMPSTQENILEAWKTYVSRGIILENKVRPLVAQSWERCRDLGLDPWSSDFPKGIDSLLQEKREQYAELLSLAGPVMNYIYTLLDCNVSICDSEGFVFELITPLKHYPRTLGSYTCEKACGNGAITIALKEKIPMRTDGYEHYRMISQNHSGVSSPIMVNNTLIGVLNGVSPFGGLPEKALPMIISATKIIEKLLVEKHKRSSTFEGTDSFNEMIDSCSRLVVTLSNDGTILAANQAFKTLLNIDNLVDKSMGNYLAGKSDLTLLMNSGDQLPEDQTFKFKGHLGNRKQNTPECLLLRKKQIRLLNGATTNMLVFDKSYMTDAIENSNNALPSPKYPKPIVPQEVDYIGRSASWAKVDSMIQKTAQFPSNVLLQGETGTGKEVVAKAIHRQSQRKGNFVAINCGALPKDLLHSELFGYDEGAFTGARAHGSIGKFEHAHEGTLLLDEIGEMPLDMQVTLLRFLQERTITRINSNKLKKVDVRIVAATNKDMSELVRTGQFRQDLYYRLNVIEINLPPLRERKNDIPLLAEYFILELSKQFRVQPKRITQDALHILCQYDWPGNVRELKNAIEKAMILSEDLEISPDCLPDHVLHCTLVSNTHTLSSQKGDSENNLSERNHIIHLLEQYDGNIVQTAKALNIARNTLYRKIEKLNIKLKTSAVQK